MILSGILAQLTVSLYLYAYVRARLYMQCCRARASMKHAYAS